MEQFSGFVSTCIQNEEEKQSDGILQLKAAVEVIVKSKFLSEQEKLCVSTAPQNVSHNRDTNIHSWMDVHAHIAKYKTTNATKKWHYT